MPFPMVPPALAKAIWNAPFDFATWAEIAAAAAGFVTARLAWAAANPAASASTTGRARTLSYCNHLDRDSGISGHDGRDGIDKGLTAFGICSNGISQGLGGLIDPRLSRRHLCRFRLLRCGGMRRNCNFDSGSQQRYQAPG